MLRFPGLRNHGLKLRTQQFDDRTFYDGGLWQLSIISLGCGLWLAHRGSECLMGV